MKLAFCIVLLFCYAVKSFAFDIKNDINVTTDSRIKTFVYSPNEVFTLNLSMDYQTAIELEKDEAPEVISFGDPFPWSVNPIDNRVFIKPTEPSARTNMMIITNKRIYYFEIFSSAVGVRKSADMVYVVRFVYPKISIDSQTDFDKFKQSLEIRAVTALKEGETQKEQAESPNLQRKNNFEYSIANSTGVLVPTEVYDDGRKTYIKFSDAEIKPEILYVDSSYTITPIQYRRANGYIILDKVYNRFVIKSGSEKNIIYNDKLFKEE